MKNQFCILLLLLGSVIGKAQTSDTIKSTPMGIGKNYFYLSPFNLISSQFLIGYGRDFNKRHSMEILPGVIVNDDNYSDVDVGASAEIQYRYHMVAVTNPREKAKNKFRFDFYMAPFAQYQFLRVNVYDYYYDSNGSYVETTEHHDFNGVSGGLLFGTRFVFFERFSIDTYAGGGVKYSDKDLNSNYYYDNSIFRAGYTGIIGKVNLQIGVVF